MKHWTAGIVQSLQAPARAASSLMKDDFENFKVGSAVGLAAGSVLSFALMASSTTPQLGVYAAVASLLLSVGTLTGGGVGVAAGLATSAITDKITNLGDRLSSRRSLSTFPIQPTKPSL